MNELYNIYYLKSILTILFTFHENPRYFHVQYSLILSLYWSLIRPIISTVKTKRKELAYN